MRAQNRDLRINVPVSADVKKHVKKLAIDADLTVSELFEKWALGAEVVRHYPRTTTDQDALKELQAIGKNLNQALKVFHASGDPEHIDVVAAAISDFRELWKQLKH